MLVEMFTLLKRFKKHKTYKRNVFCKFIEKKSADLHFLQGAIGKILIVVDTYKNIF